MSLTKKQVQDDEWDILPNGMLSKASMARLKEMRKQSDIEMKAYQNSQEFKEYSRAKDEQIRQELEVLRKER